MAINKFMKATLKALSYPDLNVKENYEFVRKVKTVVGSTPPKAPYVSFDHVIENGDYEIPVRIFKPDIDGHFPVLIFFHGGGWVTGNIDSYTRVCANMAVITKNIVVSVDYRLAPEHKFPTAVEDCYCVTQEILNHPYLFSVKPEEVTLIGDSAGGNLAAAVSLMSKDKNAIIPKRQILIYPSTYYCHDENSPFQSIRDNGTDYLLTSKRVCDYLDMYVSCGEDRKSPYFAPLLAESPTNQPDTLIVTAEYDPLRDEGEAYGEKLRQFGNNVEIFRIPDALHGFISLPLKFPVVGELYDKINEFLHVENNA